MEDTVVEQISHYFYVITNQLSTIGFADVVDIIVVAFFLYYTFKFMKDRRAGKLALGVILMLLMLLVSDVFQMRATYFMSRKDYQRRSHRTAHCVSARTPQHA